jgi:hypothetical protein
VAPPSRDQLFELQAQVLALRAVVEALLAKPESQPIQVELARSSNAMVRAVVAKWPHEVPERVVERAKKIVHLDLKLPR